MWYVWLLGFYLLTNLLTSSYLPTFLARPTYHLIDLPTYLPTCVHCDLPTLVGGWMGIWLVTHIHLHNHIQTIYSLPLICLPTYLPAFITAYLSWLVDGWTVGGLFVFIFTTILIPYLVWWMDEWLNAYS